MSTIKIITVENNRTGKTRQYCSINKLGLTQYRYYDSDKPFRIQIYQRDESIEMKDRLLCDLVDHSIVDFVMFEDKDEDEIK